MLARRTSLFFSFLCCFPLRSRGAIGGRATAERQRASWNNMSRERERERKRGRIQMKGKKRLIRAWHEDDERGSFSVDVVKDKRGFMCGCNVLHLFAGLLVQPKSDLLSLSCSDAPEAPTHRSYCFSCWTDPVLHNTASVPGLCWQWDTRVQFSVSDWRSCVSLTLPRPNSFSALHIYPSISRVWHFALTVILPLS